MGGCVPLEMSQSIVSDLIINKCSKNHIEALIQWLAVSNM